MVPIRSTCEAVCETGSVYRDGVRHVQRGFRCPDQGVLHEATGRVLCWVHQKKAEEGRCVFIEGPAHPQVPERLPTR